jgi:hypothetical protein
LIVASKDELAKSPLDNIVNDITLAVWPAKVLLRVPSIIVCYFMLSHQKNGISFSGRYIFFYF